MTDGTLPDAETLRLALTQAQATIDLLTKFVYGLATTIGAMGLFFGVKWIGAMVEGTKASMAQATSNDKLADAVKALTGAVLHGKD